MLMKFLDPRFRSLVHFARDTGGSTRAAARAEAETVAAQSGYSFRDALDLVGVRLDEIEDAELIGDDDDDALSVQHDRETVVEIDVQPEKDDQQAIGTEAGSVQQRGLTLDPLVDSAPIDRADDPVIAALKAGPARADRDIARECQVSPSTVAKRRGLLGLGNAVRSVVRGGKTFEMDVADRS